MFSLSAKLSRPLLALLGASFLVGFLALPSFAQKATDRTSEVRQEQSRLSREIQEKRAAAAAKKKEAEELKKIIGALERDIRATQNKISQTQDQISSTQATINDLEGQIKVKEAELLAENQVLDEALVNMYQVANTSTLFIVLGSKNLSQVLSFNEYLDTLEATIEGKITTIEAFKADLQAKKNDQEKKKQELVQTKDRLQGLTKALDEQRGRKNAVLSDTKTAIRSFEAQVAEAQRRYTELAAEMSRLAAAWRKGQFKAPPGVSAVGFAWPVDFIYISQPFGVPWIFNPNRIHTGVDLVTGLGTPVFAAADGVVGVQTSVFGYGNYIFLVHNERFASLYAHLDQMLTSPGQEVKRGDLIGTVGLTGLTTGPHLHFEVWDGGHQVDPLAYLP